MDSASAWACAAMERNPWGPLSQRHQSAGDARLRWWPPPGGAEERLTECEERLPAIALGGSDHEGPPLVAVTLTGCPESAVQRGGGYVEHAAERPPGRI